MNIILEKELEDQAFIRERTEGFRGIQSPCARVHTGQSSSEITGVPVEQLYQAAEIMGTTKPMAVLWAMGITQHVTGVRNVMNLANLQMLLGNMGVPGGGSTPCAARITCRAPAI
jgi:formate dehydrogenase major subunit